MHQLLVQLRGLRCSAARIGIAQMLSFEFGDLDPAGIGDLSLWLEDAEWRIDTGVEWIASRDDGSDLRRFVLKIVGKVVTGVTMGPNADLKIEFDTGAVLHAFVVRHPDLGKAWILYGEATILSSAPEPPYFGTEAGSLRMGPDIPFIRNVQRVFGDDAARQLIRPDRESLILPDDTNDR